MVIPLRRRATKPSAQRPSEGREAEGCQRHTVFGAAGQDASNGGTKRAAFRAGVRNAGYASFDCFSLAGSRETLRTNGVERFGLAEPIQLDRQPLTKSCSPFDRLKAVGHGLDSVRGEPVEP